MSKRVGFLLNNKEINILILNSSFLQSQNI